MRRLISIVLLVGMLFVSCVTTSKNQAIDVPNSDLNNLAMVLTTPELLLDWMDTNLRYGWPGHPNMSSWEYLSPDKVLKLKQGECVSQSGFADYILSKNGYETHLLFVNRTNGWDHAVCYWVKDGKLYYIEHAFYKFKGLYGPFDTKKEVGAHVYNHLILKDGKKSSYRVTNFDKAGYGYGWKHFIQGR